MIKLINQQAPPSNVRLGYRISGSVLCEASLVSGLSFLSATWAHIRSARLAVALARWFLGEQQEEEVEEGGGELGGSPLIWVRGERIWILIPILPDPIVTNIL